MNEKKIRVLQVFGSLNMGGAESRMMDIYRRLDLSQVEFDFFAAQKGGQYFEKEIEEIGGKICKASSPREVGIARHIKDLRKCMRNGRYDAVHAHTSYHCGIVMLAAWLEHIPVRVSHARTTGSKSASKNRSLSLALGRLLANMFSTRKFAISKDAGEFLFGRKKFQVVPNSIDVEKYQEADSREIARLKNELGLDGSSFVVGQIGRFDSMKNHGFTVKWFEQYSKQNEKAVLVFVGDGSLRKEIEGSVKNSGLSDRVIFTGVRGDVNKLIHIFDVLIFPSVFEGLGGVALEAQASGVPVVESDTVPQDTDLKLGLVKRCSLNDDFSIWSKAVDDSREVVIPGKAEINRHFDLAGYSIDAVTEKYINAYKGL